MELHYDGIIDDMKQEITNLENVISFKPSEDDVAVTPPLLEGGVSIDKSPNVDDLTKGLSRIEEELNQVDLKIDDSQYLTGKDTLTKQISQLEEIVTSEK